MSNELNVDLPATKETYRGLQRCTVLFAAIFVVTLGSLFIARNLSESSDIPYNRSNLIVVIPSCEERCVNLTHSGLTAGTTMIQIIRT